MEGDEEDRKTVSLKNKKKTKKNRGTQGFVDETPHNWVVQGEGKGGEWWVRRSRQTGRRQCNKACQKENLLLANSFAPVPSTPYLHEICVGKKGQGTRREGEQRAKRVEL